MHAGNSTKATVLAVLIVLGTAVSSPAGDSRFSIFSVLSGFAAYGVTDTLHGVRSFIEQIR